MITTEKIVGSEKPGVVLKIDNTLDRKEGVTSFPKKLATAKKNLSKLKLR